MENVTEITTNLQDAIRKLYAAKSYEEQSMAIAQRLGLQGEKRRMRYMSARTHNLINYILCDSFDVYGITLKRETDPVEPPQISTIEGFFTTSLAKVQQEIDALGTIANKLVLLNADQISAPLKQLNACLTEARRYYNRTILEGGKVSWHPDFILLHQTTACNIHDDFEQKEKEVGYCF